MCTTRLQFPTMHRVEERERDHFNGVFTARTIRVPLIYAKPLLLFSFLPFFSCRYSNLQQRLCVGWERKEEKEERGGSKHHY